MWKQFFSQIWHCFFFKQPYENVLSLAQASSLVAQRLKHLPSMQETLVRSLGREDPLEKEMAIHSSILAWRIPWMEKPSRLQSMGSQRVGHDWVTSPSIITQRVKCHVTELDVVHPSYHAVSLPGNLRWEKAQGDWVQAHESASVQFSSVPQSRLTLCDPMNHSTPGVPVHHQFVEFTQTHAHRVSDAIQPPHPLSSPSPPAPNPPSIRVFSNESTLCMRWPKYWSFSFNISPFNEHPGLISFRMDWLDLLAVQGTFKSLLQNHSPKASILWYSAFFTVQLSHPYVTTGKTIAFTRWTFVGKVISLLFRLLSRLIITFLSRSKRLLISWLQSPSAVILEPKK